MTTAKKRKLKVFQAQFGFYDSVVAASSQAAALRAWGTHQNLFASDEAKPATDETAIAAALAHPETPLRRPVGSTDAFVLEPTGLPAVPPAPDKPASKTSAKAPAKPNGRPRPPADRSALDAAELALHKLQDRRKREEDDWRAEQAALDKAMAKGQSRYVTAQKAASAKVARARDAYRKAGGAQGDDDQNGEDEG